jgi:hypothetical protein
MGNSWQFQLRISFSAERAAALRAATARAEGGPLGDILRKHDASLKCQFDAFADYVSEAERSGAENYPLYQWTRETIENPEKKSKYLKVFTVYVNGAAVYSGAIADSLQSKFSALGGDTGIESIVRFDTNPANNPQPHGHKH